MSMSFSWFDSFHAAAGCCLDRRGARPCANHGIEIPTAPVLDSIGFVDPIVDGTIDRFECDFLRHAGGGDPSGFLAYRRLIPTRVPPAVGANVHSPIPQH